MMFQRHTLCILFLLSTLSASSQCRYCHTYEDFMEGKWEPLDTVYAKKQSKSKKLLVGGSDFMFTTGDKATDKMLKKDAFAVKQGNTLYVNCCNLRYQNDGFGFGYTKAMTMKDHGLLFVNKKIGKEAIEQRFGGWYALGTIGGLVATSQQLSQQVCYLITEGASEVDNLIQIKLIDDNMINQILSYDTDLFMEYYSETNASQRIMAEHVLPLLKKAGFFTKIAREDNETKE